MLFNIRSIAAGFAVLGFFVIAILGWISGLSQLTCCKRALIVAIIVYFSCSLALRVVNAILMDAIVNSQMKQKDKEAANGSSS